MGKKRKFEEVEENDEEGFTTLNDSQLESPPKKSKRPRIEEEAVGNESEGEFELWLVRKPADVPIDDLVNLKFPKKFRSKKLTIESAIGEQDADGKILEMDCEFEKVEKDMLHIPRPSGKSEKEQRKLKPAGVIGGVALISRRAVLLDKGPIKAEDNFLEPEDPNAVVEPMPFPIKSIRRKPKLKLSGLKQRLTAFGCRDRE